MSDPMIGPWSFADWQAFTDLDDHYGRNALAKVTFGQPARLSQFTDAEQAWAARRASPVYQWMMENAPFLEAHRLFLRLRKHASGGKILSPFAEFIFLRIVARHGAIGFLAANSRAEKPGATARKRMAAIRAIDDLRRLFADGVRIDDSLKHVRLESMLADLRAQLASTKRKVYEGKDAPKRTMLQSLAYHLVKELGLASPAIVTHVADMTGLSCEYRTAQRYCTEGKTLHRRVEIARAMETPDTAKNVPLRSLLLT